MKKPIQISGADQILSIFIFQFGQNFGKFAHNHIKIGHNWVKLWTPLRGPSKLGEAKRGLEGA